MQGIYHQDTFVELADEQAGCGFAVLSRGLPEYEIVPGRNTIALTLFRAVGWLSKQFHLGRPTGLNGPSLPTPGAQCLREFSFEYAAMPHQNDWKNEELNQVAQAYAAPPLLQVIEGLVEPSRDLVLGTAFIAVSNPLIWVSAIKKAENADAVAIRVYNTGDTEQSATLTLGKPVQSVFKCDLLDNPEEAVAVQGNAFEIKLPSSRIQTYLIYFE
jgi:mannosylglycerate hydrolase